MRGIHRPGLPSPAMVVAVMALFVALGGTGYAAGRLVGGARATAAKAKSKKPAGDTSADSKLVKKLASGLSVKYAKTAGSATNATNATNATHAATAGSAAPSGSAGGSLSGSYPNPSIAAGAVTPAMVGSIPAAVLTNTADIPIPGDGSHNLISFDTEQVNIDGVHSGASPSRLTAPIAGLYAVHGEANWYPCASSSTGFEEIEIYLNGATRVGVTSVPIGSSACSAEGVDALVKMSAGDYVQLDARQTSGNLGTIRGTHNEGAPDTPEFDMHWVGPAS